MARLLWIALLAACVTPPALRAELRLETVGLQGLSVQYAQAGLTHGPLVVFVHGTPGSLDAFAGYLEDAALQARARLIALDRPGFGGSANDAMPPPFAVQAQVVEDLVTHLNPADQPVVVVGHSLGGSIAYRVAANAPAWLDGIVAVSSNIDPSFGAPRWYNRLAALPLIRWLVPGSLKRANVEIMPLRAALAATAADLPAFTGRVVVIHGERDGLVRADNMDRITDLIAAERLTRVRVADVGHFVLWERPALIRDQILALLDELGDEPSSSSAVPAAQELR
ncbi:MAG: alpha/beta fold hydrolase [Pseudomonadota bacterium]